MKRGNSGFIDDDFGLVAASKEREAGGLFRFRNESVWEFDAMMFG
jgi:hypothetical protein